MPSSDSGRFVIEVLHSSILVFRFLYYRQGSVSLRFISSTDLYFIDVVGVDDLLVVCLV